MNSEIWYEKWLALSERICFSMRSNSCSGISWSFFISLGKPSKSLLKPIFFDTSGSKGCPNRRKLESIPAVNLSQMVSSPTEATRAQTEPLIAGDLFPVIRTAETTIHLRPEGLGFLFHCFNHLFSHLRRGVVRVTHIGYNKFSLLH